MLGGHGVIIGLISTKILAINLHERMNGFKPAGDKGDKNAVWLLVIGLLKLGAILLEKVWPANVVQEGGLAHLGQTVEVAIIGVGLGDGLADVVQDVLSAHGQELFGH